MVESFRQLIEDVNPFLRSIRLALSDVDASKSGPRTIALDQPTAGGEIAAIIETRNLQTIEPRRILYFRQSDEQPRFMSILSHQYEPMQYPILFPHGTAGWGVHAGGSGLNTDSRKITQIQWYRFNLLSERRFLQLGRLACEY